MLERADNRRGGSSTIVQGAKATTWERLCLFLCLEDAWLHPSFAWSTGSLAFSRLDRRVGGMNMSRINRMYASDMFGDCGGNVGILAGTCLFDNSLILLVSNEGRPRSVVATWIPAGVQTDSEIASQVEQIWQWLELQSGSLGETMADGLQLISSFLLS